MTESIWNDPRITAYVLGEMTDKQRRDFESEIESSSELASAVEEARTVTAQLNSLYETEAIPALDEPRRAAIVDGSNTRLPGHDSTTWVRTGWLLAVAAALLLLVGGASVISSWQRAEEATMASRAQRESELESALSQLSREHAVNELQEMDERPAGENVYLYVTPGIAEGVESSPRPLLARAEKKSKTSSLSVVEIEAVPESGMVVSNNALSPGHDSRRYSLGKSADGDSTNAEVRLAEAKVRFVTPKFSADKGLGVKRLLEQQTSDFALPIDEGRGPGIAGDRFDPITDNPFQRVSEHPLSTFSVDVDTASYSKVRDYLMRANQLPRPDAVRIEEMINYFSYSYEPPSDSAEHPFAARVNVTSCPWNEKHRLARIALQGKTMEPEDRPLCNLVFLIDTSGSMNAPNKLPLVVEGMKLLLKQLNDDDRVAIAVYAGSAGLVLDSTPAQKEKRIRRSLTQLSAGGSTNGGAGIALAYQTARDHFLPEGVNRVILCTDGDFNVGTTGTDELVKMVEKEAKGGIFLSVLGFGMGNHNDAMLEQISGRGNGNYAFIDSRQEARKVLVEQTSGTLVTIAKDVKLQIEFNPTKVSSYRLIGYENRVLAKEDFNDDKKDAGEIGAGHSVTALYELVPAGIDVDAIGPKVDELKYQSESKPTDAADSEELMTLKLRYKEPDGEASQLVEFPIVDGFVPFDDADNDLRFAAAVASFGMQLRRSPYAGSWTLSDAMNTANRAKGTDRDGLRDEFVTLVQKASELMGEE